MLFLTILVMMSTHYQLTKMEPTSCFLLSSTPAKPSPIKSKKFTKPATAVLAADIVSDITRSRKDLIAENAILRQQLIVLNRQVKRPKFTKGDRLRLVFLSRFTQFWNSALHLVQPQTVLRWHRDLFRRYWKRKSRAKNRKPRIPQETIELIKEMAQKNWLWGAEKIQGELLKLGIKVSKRIVTAYAEYYNQHRAHQGIQQRIPAKLDQPRLQLSNQVKSKVIATPVLNGLHHSYAYAAC